MDLKEHVWTRTRGKFPTEQLPYRVGIVRTHEQLAKVCRVRELAYGHHYPHIGQALAQPEAIDFDRGSAIFYAEDKSTGEFVATARIQSNEFAPLALEAEYTLPDFIANVKAGEVARFAVLPSYPQQFRSLFKILSKTIYLYSLASLMRYIVLGARSRGLERSYLDFGCQDIDPTGKRHVLIEGGGLPHRLLYLDIFAAEPNWRKNNVAAYDWYIGSLHPDLAIFGSLVPSWTQPRQGEVLPDDLKMLQIPRR